LKVIPASFFSGNVNMVERTNEQQKMLEKRKADLADRRRAELEVAAQLEAQEEMGEELGKTYTSLQQEVDQFSCQIVKSV
jgi:hypothetical protein